MIYQLLANAVLVAHISFIGFVVGLIPVIVLGSFLHWDFVSNPWLRLTHFGVQFIFGIEGLLGLPCPSTVLENYCRSKIGRDIYMNGFLDHWVQKIFNVPITPLYFNLVSLGVISATLLLLFVCPANLSSPFAAWAEVLESTQQKESN